MNRAPLATGPPSFTKLAQPLSLDARADGRPTACNAPLRVAVVAACPFPMHRGTPIRILRSSEAIRERGHDVRVVTYHLGDDRIATPLRIVRTPALATYRRRAAGPSYQKLLLVDPLLALRVREVIRSARPDVIHAHHYEGLLVALAARGWRSIPVVYDAHTTLASELHHFGLGMPRVVKKRLGALLDRLLPGRADAVIAVSDTIRDSLGCSLGPHACVDVIPNGIEHDRFVVDDMETDPTRLIFTGNLSPYQRLDLMFEAFRRALLRHPEAKLQIVLDEPPQPCWAMAVRYGVSESVSIVETGFQDVPSLLAAASIALNPRTECAGLPQKVLNYMASGRAIVSSAGSAKHLRDGETALIVPDGDVEAFAAAIVALLAEPARARRLGDAARREALEKFSWARVAADTEKVYRRTIETREARRRGLR